MKSLKPFLLVLVGVLITVALLSFKNEEPKKEYLVVQLVGGAAHIYSDGEMILKDKNANDGGSGFLSKYAKEGWYLKESTSSGASLFLYLERIK